MQTREEFEQVMDTLQRHALERKLAEPAVSFALHAIDCHHDLLRWLKIYVDYLEKMDGVTDAFLAPARAAIAKAESQS